jgi:membrane protein HdeD
MSDGAPAGGAGTNRGRQADARDVPGDEPVVQRRRTGWDVVLGVLLIIAALLIFGNVVLATVVSVTFLGWLALTSGIVLLISALFRIRSGGFFLPILGGVGLAVLGVFILRNTLIGALTLTLLAGSLFLTTGLVRAFASGQFGRDRWLVLISGLISAGLGVFILLNLVTATATLIGVLLGVQTLLEGITLLVAGRTYVSASSGRRRRE